MQELRQCAALLVVSLSKGFRSGSGVGAGAPTPITVQLSPHCVQFTQLIERSAFGPLRRSGSSSLEHGSPAEQRIVAGAAVFVENGLEPAVTQGLSSEEPLEGFCGDWKGNGKRGVIYQVPLLLAGPFTVIHERRRTLDPTV